MHPVLFKIGWFEANSYGLMLMVGFLLGILLAVRRAKKREQNPNNIMDLSMILIVSGLVGARGMYVIFHRDEFKGKLLDIINPFQSDGTVGIAGLIVLGGIILAILNSIIYLKYKRLSILPLFNILAPSAALGIAITRIGCFLHGCCYGTPSSGTFGVIFPINSPAGFAYPGQPIHPTQLYASLGAAIIFILLLLSEKLRFFKNKTFFLFLILYGISRFTVDIFRYYEDSMVLLQLNNFSMSVNQGITIVSILIGIGGIMYVSKKNKTELFPHK